MRIVTIIDTKTQKIAAQVPVSFQLTNNERLLEDYYNEAWQSAVEEALVDARDRRRYKFRLDS